MAGFAVEPSQFTGKRWWLIIVTLLGLAGCGPEGYARIDPGGDYAYSNPAWSPDSQQIAYTRCELYDKEKGRAAPGCELFVMTVATRETKQITRNDIYDGQPSWSPDGPKETITLCPPFYISWLFKIDNLRCLSSKSSKLTAITNKVVKCHFLH